MCAMEIENKMNSFFIGENSMGFEMYNMTKTRRFDDIDKNYIFDILIDVINEYTTI
jgi:hypothetical protein